MILFRYCKLIGIIIVLFGGWNVYEAVYILASLTAVYKVSIKIYNH